MKQVHLLRNQWNRWVMHQFLLELGLYFRDELDYDLIMHDSNTPVSISIGSYRYIIADTDIVMYDQDSDTLRAISYSYRLKANGDTGLLDIFQSRNNENDVFLVRNCTYLGVDRMRSADWKFRVQPTIFYGFNPQTNYYYWHAKRKLIAHEDLIDKMWFKGQIFRGDEKVLGDTGYLNKYNTSKMSHSDYLDETIKYKIGLSIPGVSELCHRDFEYMAVGLPILRFEFAGRYIPEIKPNYHYISIDRGDSFPPDHLFDQRGGDLYVEKYISRFKEVRNDVEFLKFISKNAHQYYKDHCSPENMVPSILKQLQIT